MRRRDGFTLIELLVVLAIIVTLATLLIALAPQFGDRQRASRGASMVQSWLNLAKQRAIRDRRPVGIRMPVPSPGPADLWPAGVAYISELMYVEVPDEGIGGTITVPFPTNGTPDYRFIGFTTPVQFKPNSMPNNMLSPQFNPAAMIQSGDVISFPDRPMASYGARRIAPTNVPVLQNDPDDGVIVASSSGSPPMYTYKVRLDTPLPPVPFTTRTHAFSRKARPVVGEPVLQLPKGIAIDISIDTNSNPARWYRMFPRLANTGGGYPFDIVFSPSGQVVGAEGNLASRICLWVRDVTLNDPDPPTGQTAIYPPNSLATDPRKLPPGYNTLITVYTRTGHVTSHPINPNGLVPNTASNPSLWNPFSFTQDGITSGNAGN